MVSNTLMRRLFPGMALLLALGSAADARAERAAPGTMGPSDMMGVSMMRHRYVVKNGLDQRYEGKTNPLKPDARRLDQGRELYAAHCARCHGAAGQGDGADGAKLWPPPGNIAAGRRTPVATDAYLFWTIAEGGAPLNSPMPAYGNTLGADEIWEIILYLRTL
jgi:mono/diheme cytochrome c family protein